MEFIYDVIVSIATARDDMMTTLATKKIDELRELAKMKGVKTGRKKQDIINALIDSNCSGPKFVLSTFFGIYCSWLMLSKKNVPEKTLTKHLK